MIAIKQRRFRTPCASCRRLPWAPSARPRCVCHGVNLDIGCGDSEHKGYLGVDRRALPKVDVVWDIEDLPWPFPDHCADKILMSHVLEHLGPKFMVEIFNEAWRVLKPDGQWMFAVPYAGSVGFWQDPTHAKGFTERTLAYFVPNHPDDPSGILYSIYRPLPWKLTKLAYSPLHNLEAILEPVEASVDLLKRNREIAKVARISERVIRRFKRHYPERYNGHSA